MIVYPPSLITYSKSRIKPTKGDVKYEKFNNFFVGCLRCVFPCGEIP